MSTAQYRVDNAMGLYFPFIWRGTQEEEGGDVPIGYYGVVRGWGEEGGGGVGWPIISNSTRITVDNVITKEK